LQLLPDYCPTEIRRLGSRPQLTAAIVQHQIKSPQRQQYTGSANLLNGKQQEKVPAPDTTISPIRKTSSRAPSTTPSYSYGDCGVANLMDEGTDRIVGRVQAIPNEFPWQAFVKVETNACNIYYCGGSLIADRWIRTSARCVLIPR
jgi:hypothetical protein